MKYNCYKYNSTFCMVSECNNFQVNIKNNIKMFERFDIYITTN